MGIPDGIGAFEVQFPVFVHVRIVHPFVEGDVGPGVVIVVPWRKFHCEFEDGIGVETAAEEYDTVECAEMGLTG